ncbi:MFS transporter [Phytohabitans houttuyneae]|uniref:MFS transporter n=1 Tax=Phytohabitans houttuyneae TaxID=1076126 RepID=A0A6V8KTC0_9ACTN|nr:MFS transporter [Phytohabitans houttuyneae]GFJ85571.1 MFS transporter [Phytohabitans houttuyneae]
MTTVTARPRAGTMLAVLLTGQAMASMDNSIVAVAAPAIRADLGGSGAVQQLVLAGYTLAFAVLVVTGARIGSRYGYQRVFLLGLAGFTVTSLACGLAPGAAFLVAARIAQGAAAAIMTPQVLSLIQVRFEGAARARAIGLYSMILALGVAAGQIVGGLVVSLDMGGLSWRPAFLVNVPIGLVLLVVGPRLLPAGTPVPARLDLTGVWLLSAAMVGVVLPLVLGREQGWPAWAWALPLGGGVALLAAFVRHERRVGAPLVDLTVLATRPVRLGLLACCAVMGCYAAFLFALTLHLQDTLGFSALAAGLAFVPYATGFATSSLLARRLPARVVSVTGPLAFAAAVLAVAGIGQSGWPWGLGSALLLVGGAGHAAGFTPLVTRISPLIRPDQAASFSAMVSTGALLASVLGVAALGAVYLGTGSFALVAVLIAVLLCGGAASASRV